MKRWIMSAFVLLLVAAWVSACGSDADTDIAPTAETVQPTPTIASQDEAVEGYAVLVDNLRAAGATVEPAGEITQEFFSTKGQVIKVNGTDMQVFEYESEADAEADAATVAPDGSSVGTSMMMWVATPHFYRASNVIVLLVGDDTSVSDLLESVVGPQFAGGASAAGEPPTPALVGRIAFTGREVGAADLGPGDIFVMNPDGSGRTQLTDAPANDWYPAWSPDGTQIAFVSDRDGNPEIYVVNADGSELTRVTNDPAEDWAPAWSPGGSKIAFRSDRDGNVEIYTMNLDGSGLARLTNDPALDADPAWSPDGTQIAFVSNRGGDADIYLVNADGSGLTQLTHDAADEFDPNWSPSSNKIAFIKGSDIYVMNSDGSGLSPVSTGGGIKGRPGWSPDGKWIVFDSGRAGGAQWGVYAITVDGSTAIALTPSGPGYSHQPAWSSRGE